jgi:hypothetical protein
MDTTSTFAIPMNTILHAPPQQHVHSDNINIPSLSRSPSRLFEKHARRSPSPSDKAPLNSFTAYPTNETTLKRRQTLSPHDATDTLNQSAAVSRTLGLGSAMLGGRSRPRPRGESDLGRPFPAERSTIANGFAFSPIAEDSPPARYTFL